MVVETSEEIATGFINVNVVKFSFCERWSGMVRTAQFAQRKKEEDKDTVEFKVYNVLIDDMTGTAAMPNEVEAGELYISAFGVDPDTGMRITSIPAKIIVKESGFMGDGETPIPPTPDLYAQLVQLVYSAAGVPIIGDNGNWYLDGIDTGIKADWSAEQENAAASAAAAKASEEAAKNSETAAETAKGKAETAAANAEASANAASEAAAEEVEKAVSQLSEEIGYKNEGVYGLLAKRTYNQFNKFDYNVVHGIGHAVANDRYSTIYFDVDVNSSQLVQFYNPIGLSRFGIDYMYCYTTNEIPDVGSAICDDLSIVMTETDNHRGYKVATNKSSMMAFSFRFPDGTENETKESIIKEIVETLCVVVLDGVTSPKYADYPYIDYFISDVQRECFDDEIKADFLKNVRHTTELVVRHGSNRVSYGTVTLGEGWNGSISEGFVHTSGYTKPISISGMFFSGDWVLVTLTNSNVTYPRQVFVSVGDATIVDTYFGKATTTLLLKCSSNVLKITPVSGYSGTITLDSVCRLSSKGAEKTTLNLDTFHYGDASPQMGFWNVLLGGENSFGNAIAVTRSIAIGSYSLDAIEYGSRHVAIGTYALRQMVEGERNVSIGADSMYQVKKADDNVAIGFDANGSAKNETYRNVSLGNYSMCDAPDGAAENVAIGHYAGRCANKMGVYIGMRAGYKASGNGNTVIGAYAMAGNTNKSGTNNTVIGRNAQSLDSDVTGATAIGYSANATKNNQVVLGGDNVVETLLKGDLIIKGTDGVSRQIVFNADGSCSWTSVE